MADPQPSGAPRAGPRLARWLAWVGVLLALGGVFAAYLQPAMAMQLAQQLWACF